MAIGTWRARIRIESDGTPFGTRVIDTETGADLSNAISGVSWEHYAGERPTAVIGLTDVELLITTQTADAIETVEGEE